MLSKIIWTEEIKGSKNFSCLPGLLRKGAPKEIDISCLVGDILDKQRFPLWDSQLLQDKLSAFVLSYYWRNSFVTLIYG